MDTQTRHALKQDKFVTATSSGLEWIGANRAPVIRWTIIVAVLLGLIIASLVVWSQRSQAANQLLGQAMDIYQTPLAIPGEPAPPGQKTYATAADRAKAALPLFDKLANQYGWEEAGTMGRYFAGVAEVDMGNTDAAESDLEKASHSHDSGVAALAKLALANLYGQDGKTGQADALFNQLISHPTTTVPKSAAQLQMAELYETKDPQKAKDIYAQIKDQDKGTDAAQIATQKLNKLK